MSTLITHRKDAIYNLAAQFSSRPLNEKLLTTVALGGLASGLIWCVRDYQEFRSLGKGGLPSNIFGWAFITFLIRPIALAKSKATWTDDYSDQGAHDDVKSLPVRDGARAVAKGIVPHRQMSQNSPVEMKEKIWQFIKTTSQKYPDTFYIQKSLYERRNDALFVSKSLITDPESNVSETARISRGEICHVHDDLSVHVYLSPADAKVALDRKWGERHLLARPRPLFGKWIFGIAPTYILLYGPRDEAELEVFRVFLESSLRFMSGREDVEISSV